jgi:N-acyl-phosphatidylethanolamine-hydrolysing phospholipase D
MGAAIATQEKPQRKGHTFQNPWPHAEPHGFGDFVRWAMERRTRNRPEAADDPVLTTPPAFAVPRADPATLTATWIGHTTALLQVGGLNILTDPIWSDRASPLTFAGPKRISPPGVPFDDLPIVDAVIISHNHYDHLDRNTVQRLIARFPAAAWRVPLGVAGFIRSKGAVDVAECDWHDSTTVGGLRVTCVPAQHFSGRGLFDRNMTLWCGWVLSSDRHSVYFAGDTAFNPSFAEIGQRYGPFHLALLPIGAYDPRWFMRPVHMDPEECVAAVQQLAPARSDTPVLLATHWGTFRLTDEPVTEPPHRMRRAWSTASLPSEKLWIARLGETRVL